eukprot:Gb_18994 [translate_table: standard]
MDAEFWSARVKHQQLAEAAHAYTGGTDRYISLEDLEEDDEMREDFTCPFCYKDFDIGTLCHHIEDEHCYDTYNAVCPVCATKVGKDVVGHITLQHGHLFKIHRRRRLRKGGMPSNSTLSFLGKELREGRLQYLLEGASLRAGTHSSRAAPDPLISSFVYNLPIYEPEEQRQASFSTEESLTKNSSSSPQVITSAEPSLSAEEQEQKLEEVTERANYVQQLVLSTIFGDNF